MESVAITLEGISGCKFQIMATADELVSVVRQRVEEHFGIIDFQEVRLCVGVEELCYDVSVAESGMLDWTVQAVVATDVCKAKKAIKDRPQPVPKKAPPALAPRGLAKAPPPFKAPPPHPGPSRITLLRPFSFLNEPVPPQHLIGSRMRAVDAGIELERKLMLAVDALDAFDSDDEDTRKLLRECESWCQRYSGWTDHGRRYPYPILLEGLLAARFGSMRNCSPRTLQSLSDRLQQRECNILDGESAVWIKLIGALAPYDEDHARDILCALASLHSMPAVRAAAVRAFGSAPVWAANYIGSLQQIAYAVEADPDETVREAALASLRELEAQRPERLPPKAPEVKLAPPPPPAPPGNMPKAAKAQEKNVANVKLDHDQELQKSREEDLQTEQQALHEALLRSKADAWNADGVTLSRLTFHSTDVMSFLVSANELESCRARVESAGCSVQPAWANGALLLVPVTEQQIIEADIQLEPHSILMLASDGQLVKDTLAQLAKRKRPGLRPEHYPHGKEHVPAHPKSTNFQTQYGPQEFQSQDGAAPQVPGIGVLQCGAHSVGSWMQDVGIVVERTFLTFPIEKDVSEASTFVHSAPPEGSAHAGHTNPHKWRLPRPRDER